jgi:hypothetical protein
MILHKPFASSFQRSTTVNLLDNQCVDRGTKVILSIYLKVYAMLLRSSPALLYGLILWINLAIPMPFFRNGINHLYYLKKSEHPKSQPLYSMYENSKMCFDIVTKLLYSLVVFAREGILHEF